MEFEPKTGAVIGAAHLAVIGELQNGETSVMYSEALSEIATYITLVADPDLSLEKQMRWLRIIALVKNDIHALSE